jgi:AAA family ATP:ADP antiporter
LIAQQVSGKAARDALFLTSFHAASLPIVMAAAAVLSLLAVVWLSRLMARYSPARVMPVLFASSASGLALEWGLGFVSAPVAAVAVYLHTAVFSPVMISTFWSLINERFDPHTAKAAVARIGSGATLGGVLGGLAAWRASTVLELPTTVLCLAVLNAGCFVGALVFRARTEAFAAVSSTPSTPSTPLTERVSAIAALRTAPYLRNLALLVALGAAMSTLLDYVFSAQAAAAYGKGPPLLAFFSLFWLAVSVLSFLLQLTLGRIVMEKLGLAVNIAVLPGIVIMGGAIGLAVPGLVSSALLRGAEAIQRNTLFRSAYELLYTPLSEERKRSTKALIDVGFDRLGTVVASGVAILMLQFVARWHSSVLLGVVVAFAFVTLPIARRLQVGYVAALEEGLREGAQKLDLPPLEPQRSSVVGTRDVARRDELIRRVEALRAPDDPNATAGIASVILRSPKKLLSRTEDVLSGKVDRARRALRDWPTTEPQLATFAILLLAHKDLRSDAETALRRVAPAVTGQLIDALLDPAMDFAVRRQIPRVLAGCPTQRAADGLLLGIADERFEVRYACGRVLLKITDGETGITISPEKIFEAIRREAEQNSPDPVAVEEFDEDATEAESLAFVENLLARDRVDRRLEHMFTILSLYLEREPLRMAFRALHHEDVRHRGTALEYLETVLPSEVRAAVWPFLGETGPLPAPRPVEEILSELVLATTGQKMPAKPIPPPP